MKNLFNKELINLFDTINTLSNSTWKTDKKFNFVYDNLDETYNTLLSKLKNTSKKDIETGYIFNIDMPGFEKEEIKVHTSNNTCIIKATNNDRNFDYSFTFNKNNEKLNGVKYINGVLQITFETIVIKENTEEFKVQ